LKSYSVKSNIAVVSVTETLPSGEKWNWWTEGKVQDIQQLVLARKERALYTPIPDLQRQAQLAAVEYEIEQDLNLRREKAKALAEEIRLEKEKLDQARAKHDEGKGIDVAAMSLFNVVANLHHFKFVSKPFVNLRAGQTNQQWLDETVANYTRKPIEITDLRRFIQDVRTQIPALSRERLEHFMKTPPPVSKKKVQGKRT
jgi:hypothetical protein